MRSVGLTLISIIKKLRFPVPHISLAAKSCLNALKTVSGIRTVPLFDCLAEKLAPRIPTELVFPQLDGSPLDDSAFKTGWLDYRKQSGVNITPHQLRHAYATVLFEAGVDPKDAQELLGHAQFSTTMDIYTHFRIAPEENF